MMRRAMDKSDSIHQIYSNHKIRQQLIDYIFAELNLSNFKYKILERPDDLPLLKNNKYYISGNYAGTNCLMVFTRNKDRYYSFLIDRKTLCYDQSRINIDNVMIEPIELGMDETIYNGTIIDGILSQTGDTRVYIVTDLYIFRGLNMLTEKIKYKLINIRSYLDSCLNSDENINNIKITVNNLYEPNEISNLVNKIIPQTKQLPVRGIAFYPEISGTKLLYMFNRQSDVPQIIKHQYNHNINTRDEHHTYNHNTNITDSHNEYRSYNRNVSVSNMRDNYCIHNQNEHINVQSPVNPKIVSTQQLTHKQKQRFINKSNKPVTLVFEMRKTDDCEIYKLFLVMPYTDNGKKILKMKSFGIACIPTLVCSEMCKNSTMQTGRVLMKCTYDDNKEKWIPQEVEHVRKCPDSVETLETFMDIVIDE